MFMIYKETFNAEVKARDKRCTRNQVRRVFWKVIKSFLLSIHDFIIWGPFYAMNQS